MQNDYSLRQRIGLGAGLLLFFLMLVLPVPAGMSIAAWRTASVGVLMAIWWMTEALPIPVTALLPLILFPFLGIEPIREAAVPYANPLIFLFMGGFMIALAMERWKLHWRIALNIIYRIGTEPRRIIAGFMVAAAFLSMWISNTATAMMMLPIGLSVVALMDDSDSPDADRNFGIALMLSLAYACSIGGLGTLIGTPPNALLAGFLEETYGIELLFVDWMLMALPLVVVGLILTFFILTRIVYPIQAKTLPGGRILIEQELQKLGRMSRAEKMVAGIFGLTAVLWMSRRWLASFIPALSDAGIALFGALLLFMIPVNWKKGVFLLDWHWAKRLPWGVLILFGGGLSLAGAIRDTGLAGWIGKAMGALSNWPVIVMVLLVVLVVIMLTELTSNTATTASFLPVMAALALGIGQHPLLLMVPATVAASCAFMLPVATPPNAIIYGSNKVTIPQMARAGLVLNFVFVILVTALTYTLLLSIFDITLGEVPAWAG